MAHEIYQRNDGTYAMYSVRIPAWHHGETKHAIFEEYPTREVAMAAAGHNFTVIQRDVWLDKDTELDETEFSAIEGYKALVRDDTGAVLSIMKDSYEPIQNSVMWDVLDAIMNQPNMKYETAGTLRGGTQLWALKFLDKPYQVPGDESHTLPFVNVGLAHDGTRSLEAWATNVRTVCQNTFTYGRKEARKMGTYFSFRHTSKVAERLADAKDALKGVRKQFESYKE